eukprot:1704468-Prymnesium_polylepis.1
MHAAGGVAPPYRGAAWPLRWARRCRGRQVGPVRLVRRSGSAVDPAGVQGCAARSGLVGRRRSAADEVRRSAMHARRRDAPRLPAARRSGDAGGTLFLERQANFCSSLKESPGIRPRGLTRMASCVTS